MTTLSFRRFLDQLSAIFIVGLMLNFGWAALGSSVVIIPGVSARPSVWWSANAANNIVTGGTVTQLTDQSGNGNNAVVSDSQPPALIANDVNGLAALNFNGSAALISPTGAAVGNSSHTIFVVARYQDGAGSGSENGAVFYSGAAGWNQNSSLGSNPGVGTLWIGGFGQDGPPFDGATPLTNGVFAVLGKVYDGNGPTYTGYVNGKVELSIGAQVGSYNLGATDVGIGRQYDNGSYWGGDVAEVVVFNAALSQSDLTALETYLGGKYGIPSALFAPALNIQLAASNQVQISWQGQNSSLFELEKSTSLGGPFDFAGLWVTSQNNLNVATDSVTGVQAFYRLEQVTNATVIPVTSAQSDPDGATLQMSPGVMKLQVFSPGVVRVAYSLSNSVPPWTNSFSVVAPPVPGNWPLTMTPAEMRLDTGELEVRVNRASGAVGFFDTNGVAILSEPPAGGKSLIATNVAGNATWESQQQFVMAPGEAFYGLGQHQGGVMDYAGTRVHLQQMNPGESAVPVLVSSAGYGMLWDNPAITDVDLGANDVSVAIPSSQLYTTNGQEGGLNGSYYSGTNFNTFLFSRVDPQVDFYWGNSPPASTMALTNFSVEWDGFIQAQQAGTYTISINTDDGVGLWIDGQNLVYDWSTRTSLTYTFVMRNWAASSQHRIRIQYYQDQGSANAELSWSLPAANPAVQWVSQAANAIDYYFIHGPDLDTVVKNYRGLTGAVPMFPKWAWGYWQSKEHYASQQELTNVVDECRADNIPIDAIIQDWYYWAPNPWGSDEFNSYNYPDVSALMTQLHETNAHMIISAWARFDVGNYTNYLQLSNAGALYPEPVSGNAQYYDAFNPVGRQLYWQQKSNDLFSLGIDGWWLDASEPELNGDWGEFTNYTTAAGPAALVYNAYPLMHSAAVYAGQRAGGSSKRVFILTRSAYAGQQRNAAVTWSGDVNSTWPTFPVQIPAGLNFSLSGIPYWNTDIGGFRPSDPTDLAYDELFTRWFQFGAFCPMFRVHGQTVNNIGKEMWEFPPVTEAILINYDQLRYHLLPYIYSVAWMVTSQGYSMLRPLVMDFRQDDNVYSIPDQFLFGPALMVNPVVLAGETNRNVYLPTGRMWYDFWTGQTYPGGQTNNAAAPIGTMPLYVPAGSILPYGPSIQYATQSVDPIELRIYRGASGSFTLYEDEGDNYDYESGAYATIPISWDDSAQSLTIGARQGGFPGMPVNRTFNVVWVSSGHGTGVPSTANPDAIVPYNGTAVTVPFSN